MEQIKENKTENIAVAKNTIDKKPKKQNAPPIRGGTLRINQ